MNRLTLSIGCLVLLAGCAKPVHNLVYKHQASMDSWISASVHELIGNKGAPDQVRFLGKREASWIVADAWGPLSPPETSYRILAKSPANTQWLFVYSKPIQRLNGSDRSCTETYGVNAEGRITSVYFSTTYTGDDRYCALPPVRPGPVKNLQPESTPRNAASIRTSGTRS